MTTPEQNEITYQVKHLGLFTREFLKVSKQGIEFRGKKYQWGDIKSIKRYDTMGWNFFFWQGGAPLSYLYMNDGEVIKIRERSLCRIDQQPERDFVSGLSETYNELMSSIEKNINGAEHG